MKTARRRANGRSSRSAIPLFQMSNQAPRLAPKPIAAGRASAVAEERPAWPRVEAEERTGLPRAVVAARLARPRVVEEDEAAVAVRRSDVALKHDITLLGRLENGLGFYRFSYNGSEQAYVGVMAQEVQAIMPEAVVRGRDGYLQVLYDKLGLKFQTYDRWIASGARIPPITRIGH